ncbi:MAG: hypothetical protein ACYC5O_22675 [Anaerolineae bacterium]
MNDTRSREQSWRALMADLTLKAAVLLRALKAIAEERITGFDLVSEGEGPEQEKYDEFVPPELLRKAFATDWLDVAGLQDEMRGW